MSNVRLQRVRAGDVEFLQEMFLETISWREDRLRPSIEAVMGDPSLAKYLAGWGRPGDSGILALSQSDERLGAAWYRLFTADDRGYGFVSPTIPELGIATSRENRGVGLGQTLMEGLIELAKNEGQPALSLSVEEENGRAIRLHERLGFHRVELVGNAWTMLLMLNRPANLGRA